MTQPQPETEPQLYLVTPDGWATQRLLDYCEAACTTGARWLQYRDKSGDTARRSSQAQALVALARRHSATIIINDDVALAQACGADGVHLGEHDGDLAAARAQLGPGAIIGVSCYNQLQRAREAAAGGASYLAFGAFFASSTKPGARRAEPSLLREARELALPLCAIGGIDPAGAAQLVQAGADLIAVVSAVFAEDNPAQATRGLLDAMGRGWTLRNATRQIAH